MYEGVISSEDGAVVRSYELSFDKVDPSLYAEVAARYWNQGLVDRFKEDKPRALVSDYNLTLSGKEEELSSDTGYLLKELAATMADHEARTGERCFFGIASGNYASYLEGKLAKRGIYSRAKDERITQPPADIKGLYDKFRSEVDSELGGTVYWQANEVRPTVKLARPEGMDDATYYGSYMSSEGKRAFSRSAEIADRLGIPREYQSKHFDAFELLIPGCTKADALETMAEMYGVPRERMAYMGDNGNDKEALSCAGTPVVISNDRVEDPSISSKNENLKSSLNAAGVRYSETERPFGEGANEVIVALIESLRE